MPLYATNHHLSKNINFITCPFTNAAHIENQDFKIRISKALRVQRLDIEAVSYEWAEKAATTQNETHSKLTTICRTRIHALYFDKSK